MAKRRGEEHQALDVVEMAVGEEDVQRVTDVADREPEVADARAGVEDEHAAVAQGDLDARGIAAVAHGLRTRRRDRSPGPPDLDSHRISPRSPGAGVATASTRSAWVRPTGNLTGIATT